MRINQPLATAYYMKEEFRHFRELESLTEATRFLDDWCLRAETSEVSALKRMASTFQVHRTGLLNYYRCPISTGRWRASTTRSKPCNAKPTATATRNSSNSAFTPSIWQSTFFSDEPFFCMANPPWLADMMTEVGYGRHPKSVG